MESRDLLIYLAIKYEGDWLKVYEGIKNKEVVESPELVTQIASSIKSKAVTILDDDYPAFLRKISRPPLVLFYYGNLSLANNYNKCLSVVGSRKYTEYGETITETFVEKLAKEYIIVSGLAMGIDAIAHKTALKVEGKTIAVLGSGIDFCYPPSNQKLYEKIKEDHLILSEYPGVTEPNSANFPVRNRIIAGLSKGLLICEARKNSGSSITALWALEFNREIMCVPNNIYSDSGCNKWIKDGAYLVETPEEVLEILSGFEK